MGIVQPIPNLRSVSSQVENFNPSSIRGNSGESVSRAVNVAFATGRMVDQFWVPFHGTFVKYLLTVELRSFGALIVTSENPW